MRELTHAGVSHTGLYTYMN